jgi:predicted small lipoprotein YifL
MNDKPFKAQHDAAQDQAPKVQRCLAFGGVGRLSGRVSGLVLVCLLCACGQKGPLFLPTDRPLAPLSFTHPRGETPPTFEGQQVARALPAPKH